MRIDKERLLRCYRIQVSEIPYNLGNLKAGKIFPILFRIYANSQSGSSYNKLLPSFFKWPPATILLLRHPAPGERSEYAQNTE
jgi:hypothetical protein